MASGEFSDRFFLGVFLVHVPGIPTDSDGFVEPRQVEVQQGLLLQRLEERKALESQVEAER
jgi:hypothetical protein